MSTVLLSPENLPVGALVAVALAVGLFLYLERPAIGRATVLASLPWITAGVALHALTGIVDYPDALARVLRLPWAYLLAATLAGMVWLLASIVGGGAWTVRSQYFGVMGLGVLLPPTATLVLRGGVAPVWVAVWLVVPILAALLTYALLIGLGLWLPESWYFSGSMGATVTFGLATDGVGTALAFAMGTRIATPVRLPLGPETLPLGPGTALPGPVSYPMAVAGAVIWTRLVVAVGVILFLTVVDRWRPAAAERTLELAAVASVVVAANALLFALGGRFV
ncbi:MAG: hypothetical protein ABEH78_05660 [Haloferacaceae archaeon]